MQVKDDSSVTAPGGDTAELLARRLSDAVRNVSNGNGGGNGSGNGMAKQSARAVASDVGAAILAEASTGTAEHSDDVVLITEAIGERMKVTGDNAADLLAAARLHDIGKAWIPPELLEKPGPLSSREWELMRRHTLVGERILSSVEELGDVARLVRHSHERWDGRGYPDGLAGPEIPLGSRIIFCADAFHAIRCDRPYRGGRSAQEALAEVKRCAGTQFDPQVARALERVVRERDRRPLRGGGSARLLALLMCLVLGGAGSAVARSGLLAEPPAPPAQIGTPSAPPPGCGTAACPSVAGPVGGLGPVGALSGEPGPRPLFPGLPGQTRRSSVGNPDKATPPGKRTPPGNGKGKGKGKGHAKAKHGNSGHTKSTGPGENPGNGAAHGSSGAAPSTGGSSSSSRSGGGHASRGHTGSSKSRSGSRSRRGSAKGNAGGNGNGSAGSNSNAGGGGNTNPHGK